MQGGDADAAVQLAASLPNSIIIKYDNIIQGE